MLLSNSSKYSCVWLLLLPRAQQQLDDNDNDSGNYNDHYAAARRAVVQLHQVTPVADAMMRTKVKKKNSLVTRDS